MLDLLIIGRRRYVSLKERRLGSGWHSEGMRDVSLSHPLREVSLLCL
jgi:hypothetical protein